MQHGLLPFIVVIVMMRRSLLSTSTKLLNKKSQQWYPCELHNITLTASANEAAALDGVPLEARGGARGAGVGTLAPPGREGITGLPPILGFAGTTGFGPGAGGALLAAGIGVEEADGGTTAPALRASNSCFQAGTLDEAAGACACTGGDTLAALFVGVGTEGGALLAGGGGGGGVDRTTGGTYSSK